MSKYKIVPVEPTPEMEGAHEVFGDTSDWWNAVIAVAPAPVASAEDVERVAEALWLARTLRLLRDDPDTARLSYDELCQSVQDELRWDARAALRAMGYEVA